MTLLTKEEKERLKAAAETARAKAFCPYSGFKVGAALLLKDGVVVSGFNIENSSFSATICAERTCLFAAVSQFGFKADQAKAFALTGEGKGLVTPCGVCRQVMAEVLPSSCPVIMFDEEGVEKETTVGALLPLAFSGRTMGA